MPRPLLIVLAAVLLLLAAPAQAAPAEVVVVVADGACPSTEQVTAALTRFLSRHRARAADPEAVGDPLVMMAMKVIDEGPTYRVTLADEVDKRFADPARRCDERARTAAVLVALHLEPPDDAIEAGEPAPPAAPVAAPPAPPSPPAATPGPEATGVFLDLEALAAGVIGAPATGTAPLLAAGGALRLSVGWRFIGLSVGAAALSPASLDVGGGRAQVLRVPLDAGLRLLLRRRRVELTADAGASLDLVHAAGVDLPVNRAGTVVVPGGRLALGLRVRASERWWPLLALEGLAYPEPAILLINGAVVAGTPAWWLGLALGVAWKVL